ncbi:hypothetical protein B0H16DRAFT_1695708 [Mycena metata]|uniref:Uncharacterized protein n=1 Tax=Mycena metata TaxID=1033252 RepID=A0AAD7I505_9AGAR|nr:hypothetical protein B0H16DRAFT_1695708 [Mycena metata]
MLISVMPGISKNIQMTNSANSAKDKGLSAVSPLATGRVAGTDTFSGSFRAATTSCDRRRHDQDSQYLNTVSLRLYGAAPHPHPKTSPAQKAPTLGYACAPAGHDRLHAGRLGPCSVTPRPRRFSQRWLLSYCNADGFKEDGGWRGGGEASREPHGALWADSRICGGVSLVDAPSSFEIEAVPGLGSTDTRDKGSLRDGVHALRVPACARRATSSFSSSSHLVSVCIYPHGQAGGASTSHVGGGEPRPGLVTATGEEGEWERARDAEGRGAEQDRQSPRPLRNNTLASRADVHLSPPAPGHASPPKQHTSADGLGVRAAVPHALRGRNYEHGGDIRHAAGRAGVFAHEVTDLTCHASRSGSQAGGSRKRPLEPLTPRASVDRDRKRDVVILADFHQRLDPSKIKDLSCA